MRSPIRALVVGMMLASFTAKAAHAATPAVGTSSDRARKDALRAIPYKRLSANGRKKVSAVLSNVTIFRRLPTQIVRCDPNLFAFLVQRPDVIVNIWDLLGITNVSLRRTGPKTFRADDGEGTKSDVQFLYSRGNTHLLYCVGSYHGNLFSGAVRGGALLLLKTGTVTEKDGSPYVTARLDVFFRIDHVGIELMTKTFQPFVDKAADFNFQESAAFIGQLHRAAESRPLALKRLSSKLSKVRKEDRRRFVELVDAIHIRATRSKKAGDSISQGNTPRHGRPTNSRGTPKLRR